MEENENSSIVMKYAITRYDNGDVAIENIETEGVEKAPSEMLYKDIEDLAESLKMKRIESAAYRAIRRFYQDMAKGAGKSGDDDGSVAL